MAVNLSSKPAAAIQLYSWKPPLSDGDGISGFTLTPTGVSVEESSVVGDAVEFYLSGGTPGEVHKIAATIETAWGETLKETLYVPIYGADNAFTQTAEAVINFALRPVVGLSGAPTTDEKNDALEWLNGMLLEWKGQGADLGIAFPVTLASVIYAADEHLLAIKTNLRILVAEQYGQQVSPATARKASIGLQQIKQRLLPDDRGGVDYF